MKAYICRILHFQIELCISWVMCINHQPKSHLVPLGSLFVYILCICVYYCRRRSMDSHMSLIKPHMIRDLLIFILLLGLPLLLLALFISSPHMVRDILVLLLPLLLLPQVYLLDSILLQNQWLDNIVYHPNHHLVNSTGIIHHKTIAQAHTHQ